MSQQSPEVERVIAQNIRVQEAMQVAGYEAELIKNPNDEAIAVVSRDFMDPSRILGSVGLRSSFKTSSSLEGVNFDIRHALPLSGPNVYPADFLTMLDVVAAAAANNPEGLAANLNSPPRADDEIEGASTMRGGSIGMHADFVGSTPVDRPESRALYGLNVHYTRWGSSVVKMGLLRNLEYDKKLWDVDQSILKCSLPEFARDHAYERYGAPFVEGIELNEGDLLIFQGRQHADRGLVPVAHKFVTTSETRRSDVFTPQLGATADVRANRDRLLAQIDLTDMGY